MLVSCLGLWTSWNVSELHVDKLYARTRRRRQEEAAAAAAEEEEAKRRRRRRTGVTTKKQEPHTKIWKKMRKKHWFFFMFFFHSTYSYLGNSVSDWTDSAAKLRLLTVMWSVRSALLAILACTWKPAEKIWIGMLWKKILVAISNFRFPGAFRCVCKSPERRRATGGTNILLHVRLVAFLT